MTDVAGEVIDLLGRLRGSVVDSGTLARPRHPTRTSVSAGERTPPLTEPVPGRTSGAPGTRCRGCPAPGAPSLP
ncbi:hypothetical protein [Kutzneria albida]|uniref:hypothetical protein n=1 Tax=Kutzneria albida TaxID=43357 RepID=UPI0004AA4573|nr:hypothetical protein [Kutzneria albida]